MSLTCTPHDDQGHVWTLPAIPSPAPGTPCDCGQKRYGEPIIRDHEWTVPGATTTYCRRCGAQQGTMRGDSRACVP